MTVMVDHEIISAISIDQIGIDPLPYVWDVQPNSLDIRLGDSFKIIYPTGESVDPYHPEDVEYLTVLPEPGTGKVKLLPGQFMLASSLEKITLPRNIAAELNGISSLARYGLSVHQTGGWIDAGFSGQITLELFNCLHKPIVLHPGMRIAQLVFHRTAPAQTAYGEKPGAKYMNQTGATASRYAEGKP